MKKRKNRFVGMIASVLVLTAFLSACSAGGSNKATGENGTAATATNGTGSGEEAYHAVMVLPVFGAEPKDMQLVEDEINKRMKEKINATVDIKPISFGNFQQQINLMLSSGEKLDLFVTFSSQLGPEAASNKVVGLDKLLADQGKGVVESLGEKYAYAAKINGQTFGVPTIRDLAANYVYVMRKDLVEKYHIDVSSIKTLDDVEKVLQTIKANEPGINPIVPGGAGGNGLLIGYNYYDILGDYFGTLMDMDKLTVSNYYESPEYKALITRLHDWYKKGYVLRDSATNQIGANQLVKAGKAFSYLANGKPGFAEQESRQAGLELVTAELNGPVATTQTVTTVMWTIAQNSKNKEKAMEILNLFYTDKDIVNLINWGIEGKHYQKIEGGTIDFAAGVNAANSGYFPNWDWLTGNSYLSYIFKGGDPQIQEKTEAFNAEAKTSKALGFVFNVEPVKNEMTAVTNVSNQFKVGLESGTLDPVKYLPEFNEKLKAAGIDKIIAEKQKQLDEWAKASNVK